MSIETKVIPLDPNRKKKVLGKYKSTGCLAIDMCAACKDHYRRLGGHVKEIYLSKRMWWDFNRGMKRLIPGHVDLGYIDFDDTIIKQASIIQSQSMTFVLDGSNKKQVYN